MPLEDHYSGDDAFRRFALVSDPGLDAQRAVWEGWPALVAACQGDTLLARAIYRIAGDQALAWLDSRPPVLDGMSGIECLNASGGQARLREAILRFPSV